MSREGWSLWLTEGEQESKHLDFASQLRHVASHVTVMYTSTTTLPDAFFVSSALIDTIANGSELPLIDII